MSKKWLWLTIGVVAVAEIVQSLEGGPGYNFREPFGIVGFIFLLAVGAVASVIVWLCLPAIVGVPEEQLPPAGADLAVRPSTLKNVIVVSWHRLRKLALVAFLILAAIYIAVVVLVVLWAIVEVTALFLYLVVWYLLGEMLS